MIKVYTFKEDPPMFNFSLGSLNIWLTKRNLIYIVSFWIFPSFYLLVSFLWVWNLLVALSIEVIAIILWYVLSIFRIDNIPIDRFLINKFLYKIKKDKEKIETNNNVINFSNNKNFEDIVNHNIDTLLDKD